MLIQALLDAPMFTTRWRWNAGMSLALPRFRSGKKVPPQFQRMQAEDLVAAVFPDQIACAENLVGEREVPDHPLTNQTIDDCLTRRWTSRGWSGSCARIEAGEVRARRLRPDRAVAARARGDVGATLRVPRRRAARRAPHAGGDGAALAATRRAPPTSAASIADAIDGVRAEAWPDPINAEELHDALLWLGFLDRRRKRARCPAGATGSRR